MATAEGACCGFGVVLCENEWVCEGEVHSEDGGLNVNCAWGVEMAGRSNKAGMKGIESRLKFDFQHVTLRALSYGIGEDRDIDEMKYGDDYHLYSLITCVCSTCLRA